VPTITIAQHFSGPGFKILVAFELLSHYKTSWVWGGGGGQRKKTGMGRLNP